jgi:hypothetical protein
VRRAAFVVAVVVLAGCGGESKQAPRSQAAPAISGSPEVGATLKAGAGKWGGPGPFTYRYRWRLCDGSGGSCHDAEGAVGASYPVQPEAQGKSVRVIVTADNGHGSKSATSDATALVPRITTLYSGAGWTVALDHGKAQVFRFVGNRWVVDRTHGVTIEILGPKPGKQSLSNPPQVAITMKAKTPLVESALWVDGNQLLEKGGGTPTNGTIYGAPLKLAPGTHTAVGYARTASSGSAVAWTFTVS